MTAVPEVTAYVGLGANAGDRAAALRAAVAALDAAEGIRVEAVSPVYETEAHRLPGQPPQPDHLNAVARLRTALPPDALLDVFHALERAAGRTPDAPRWSPRPLDLDLLLYDDLVLDTPALTLPHPRLPERRFALRPLADLAPDLVVPGTGRTAADLLAACPDTARVEPTDLVIRFG
ncbi:MAG TPA: 2-amino-4-hydroxy-6-hydroxymethyldihydropteridine diphosphokinase [Rubricoccaceae bacterium]|nr:2-amino-4-hydroxy-6-hydroxymethyldihydropteridine diphosphokinase [Rubricoccaceae bacterium]